MKRTAILTFALFTGCVLSGQPSVVIENRAGLCHGPVVIKAWKAGNGVEIARDTLTGESLSVLLPNSTRPGLLSIEFDGDCPLKSCELVFSRNNVHLQLLKGNDGQPHISSDQETEFYWHANHVIDSLRQRLLGLRKLIVIFSQDDSLCMLLQQRNNETQHQITGIFEEFKKNKEFPVATSLLLARMLYVPDWRLPPVEQSREILRKYFELNDFRNPVFQRSPFFAQKITDYLSIASMQSETTKDSVLIASVDQFFLTLSASDTLLTDITAIMRKWLLQNGYDAVCEYLDVRYLSAQCTAGNDINLQERLEAYRRTAKGQTAPEIYWINGNGEHGKLSGLTGKNVTVVFWATWCQHCMETLPAIYKYTLQKMIPVIAIAIDQVEEPWGKAIGALPGWIHLRASGGWNDPWIKLYGVYGTPTIFVLDADKKIVGKVSNLDDLISLTR